MNGVTILPLHEDVHLDREYLREKYGKSDGASPCGRFVERTEALARHLSELERCVSLGRVTELQHRAREIDTIAELIGLSLLSLVASDVVDCVTASNPVALAATLARMQRVGEMSLGEIWELQGLSV